MKGIQKRLQDAGEWDPHIAGVLHELQVFGIEQVSDQKARQALVFFLTEIAPLEFFLAPASRGSHHPKWQNQKGGILRNTLECCLGIDRKMRIFPQLLDSKDRARAEDRDILLIATIVSDTFKHVDMEGDWKSYSHHRIAAQKWRDVADQFGLTEAFSERIYDAIFWHLGRFTPEWKPEWNDPSRDLSLHAFLVHMLDMDFSNKDLERIYIPKSPLGTEATRVTRNQENSAPTNDENLEFIRKEFEIDHTYYVHLETKLAGLVTFYFTLLVGTVSGYYYILVSDAFNEIRKVSLAVVAVVFFILGSFILGMYGELRTRKIRTLEQLAIIRDLFAKNTGGHDIGDRLVMVKGIEKCPPYLRRPSEDWYTILFMIFLNNTVLFAGLTIAAVGYLNAEIGGWNQAQRIVTLALAFFVILSLYTFAAYRQYRRITLFAYSFDCDREVRYGKPRYDFFKELDFFKKVPESWFDKLATLIERKNRERLLNFSQQKYGGKS